MWAPKTAGLTVPLLIGIGLLAPLRVAAQIGRGTEGSTAPASPATNPVTASARSFLSSSRGYLEADVALMPDSSYGYRLLGGMTYGQLVADVVRENRYTCSIIAGLSPTWPTSPTGNEPKSVLVAALKESFDFCASTLGTLTDSQLGDNVGPRCRQAFQTRSIPVRAHTFCSES